VRRTELTSTLQQQQRGCPGWPGQAAALAPDGIAAFVDAHGDGYVDLALGLGVAPHRIDTIVDFDGAQRHGAKTDASPQASDPDILTTMAEHVAWGRLTMPIAAINPLEQVRAAYTELAGGHVHGKIVLSTEMSVGGQPLQRDQPGVLAAGTGAGMLASPRAAEHAASPWSSTFCPPATRRRIPG